jgi:hypothetical protein
MVTSSHSGGPQNRNPTSGWRCSMRSRILAHRACAQPESGSKSVRLISHHTIVEPRTGRAVGTGQRPGVWAWPAPRYADACVPASRFMSTATGPSPRAVVPTASSRRPLSGRHWDGHAEANSYRAAVSARAAHRPQSSVGSSGSWCCQERRPHDPVATTVCRDADPDTIGAPLVAFRLDHGHGAGQQRELGTQGVVYDHPVADTQCVPLDPQHGAPSPP